MFKIIAQRYYSRNLIGLIALSILIIILIGTTRSKPEEDDNVEVEFVYSTRKPLINFDEIKIDHELALRNKMAFYKRSLGTKEKNKTWQQEIQRFLTRVSPHFQNRSICADYWIVFYEYSEIVLETGKRLPTWCIVFVMKGDEETDPLTQNIFRLTGVIQRELAMISPFYQAALLSPQDLYTARKNLGYLWAIYHEAKVIWDFDHTNEMIIDQSVLPFPISETIQAATVSNYNGTLFNPYLFFASNINPILPRGYPFRLYRVRTILFLSFHSSIII